MTSGWPSARWRRNLGGPGLPRTRCAADPPPRTFSARHWPTNDEARPFRDNGYKIELMTNIAVRVLSELAGAHDDPAAAVGTATTRVDAVAKVTGEAKYSAEIPFEDKAYGAIVQATVARGRITGIDLDQVSGVVAVLTHENAPRAGRCR